MPHSTIYVEEQNHFLPQIEALDTTQVIFIGYTRKYTIQDNENYPSITTLNDYITFYGDNLNEVAGDFVSSYLYQSVDLFFANGGRNCKILSINKNTNIVNIDIFINALDELKEVTFNIVCCPDSVFFSENDLKKIYNKILKICATKKSMYILDLPIQDDFPIYETSYFDENILHYGAAYTPWIITSINTERKMLPSSGAIAGAWVNTDVQRGVWKIPSGISLQNVVDVTLHMNDDFIHELNNNPTFVYINPLRKFIGKGVVIWGGRTLAGNISNEWKYISVCRLKHHIENSILHSLQWIIFEPNTIVTWNIAKALIENFLNYYWRMGALMGNKPEFAYFVQIGLGSTMTNFDIDNGNINVVIGLACIKPAEFNILKLSLKSN